LPDAGLALGSSGPLVVFGGSFDPVHKGHLQAADEAAQQLGAAKVFLLPCHIPPHKGPLMATPAQRLAMLTLAIADYPRLAIDPWELEQNKPSYTVDTLQRYRREYGDIISLIFLMGWDSLQTLPSWYHWQKLESLTHFAVWERPGYTELPPAVSQWLASRELRAEQLSQSACGGVSFIPTTANNISSTQLRNAILTGAEEAYIPSNVRHYINEQGLYSR